jgi:hypothetical protein
MNQSVLLAVLGLTILVSAFVVGFGFGRLFENARAERIRRERV